MKKKYVNIVEEDVYQMALWNKEEPPLGYVQPIDESTGIINIPFGLSEFEVDDPEDRRVFMIVPIEMEEEEFKSLPEFDGF